MIPMYLYKRSFVVFVAPIFLLTCSRVTLAQVKTGDEKAPISVTEQEPQNLNDFVAEIIKKNTKLRVQNSRNLFQKVVRKPKTGQLPNSMYKSLGYQTRTPFIAMPPELSTRLYQENGINQLNIRTLHELQNTWALLDSTRARVLNAKNWQTTIVKHNVALDGVNIWYRMANQQQYKSWLSELKKVISKESETLSINREEYSDKLFNKANIKLLDMESDNATLSQFLNSESAYLYLRTDSRELPSSAQSSRIYSFNNEYFCQADAKKMQIGNIYLQVKFPELAKLLNNEVGVDKIWRLTEVAKHVSKQLLSFPNDKQLLAANYLLSDTVLLMILNLNQKRLNAFSDNPEPFFIKERNQLTNSRLRTISGYVNFQNTVFNLALKDQLIARERIAFGSLVLFRGCVNVSNAEDIDLKNLIQTVEHRYFNGLKFLQVSGVENELLSVSQRWKNKEFNNETLNVDSKLPNLSGKVDRFKLVEKQENQQKANTQSSNTNKVPEEAKVKNMANDKLGITQIRETENGQVKEGSNQSGKTNTSVISSQQKNQPLTSKEGLPKTPIKPDSIIGATPEQAATWLQKNGFRLSTYEEMMLLTENKGYSIQVLTTSSPSEAAYVARRFSKRDKVRVYLSSVTIDGVVEKRYKVLATFFSGRVSAIKFQELVAATEQRKGFLKRYALVRKDVLR